MSESKGKISQVIGAVIDVAFEGDQDLPKLYDALSVSKEDGTEIILEVQQHIGEDTVRTIAMDSSDGFSRGMVVTPKGKAISMPVGEAINGRLFNVIGDSIDGMPNSFAARLSYFCICRTVRTFICQPSKTTTATT